ncbi:MAG: DUF1772 domain-containing protein [Acidobacteria bacterium]|nr:MAG: DUF1772 domain-containing protein [Acidobacteriota bacterium]
MNEASQWIAVWAAGLFSGAALYVSLVEHPARMQCGTLLAATEFGPSYQRGAAMQATLAVVGTLAGVITGLAHRSTAWLTGSLLLFLVVPFTLIVIFPTNHKLLDATLDKSSPEAHRLLVRWGRLHEVRTVLGLGAFIVFVLASRRA